MKTMIAKNQMVNYLRTSHPVVVTEGEPHYCRSLNAVLCSDDFYCKNCPLYRKGDVWDDATAACWYYDISAGYSNELSPQEMKERTDGLIAAGLTYEFPEYLPKDAPARQAIIEKAIRFAAMAHKGTFRKGSGVPYIAHPMETMMLVSQMTADEDVIAAAALHDVVEDTAYTLEDIEREFGSRIANLVNLESENKREGKPKEATWKVRKQENLKREENAPIEAKMIMLGDKISNMRATVRDFRIHGCSVWQKFNMKDEAEQEWYYRSVAKVLSDLSDLPLYQEYQRMLDEVFGTAAGSGE